MDVPQSFAAKSEILECPKALREDIQLLRGVAVLMVIAFHLQLQGFANGFLGVDIFFVISGFLMERLYKPQQGAIAFWRRRAKRLLPPYFVVIWLVVIAGLVVLLPEGVTRLSGQVGAASVFGSNILHWLEESYFTSARFSPLLHFWSLAVELQFYLVFPALTMLTRRIRWSLALLGFASFFLCIFVLTISPKTSFFMMPLRLWQFTLGMAVARMAIDTTPNKKVLVSWVALVALAVALMLPVDGTAPKILLGHPSIIALLCCVAVAAVLRFGVPERVLQSRGGRALIATGNVSYSLYLVHFPIIVLWYYVPFHGTRLGPGTVQSALIPVALMAVATWALYRGVERRSDELFTWRRVIGAMAITAVLAISAPVLARNFASPFIAKLSSSLLDIGPSRCGKFFRLMHPGEAMCEFSGPNAGNGAIYLMGDSHAEVIAEAVREVAFTKGFSVVMSDRRENFRRSADWQISQGKRYGISRILYTWRGNTNDPKTMVESIRALAGTGMPVSVLLPVPEAKQPIPYLVLRAYNRGEAEASLAVGSYNERTRELAGSLSKIKGVKVLDPTPIVCPDRCPLNDRSGAAYYFDDNHLTLTGARRLKELLAAGI